MARFLHHHSSDTFRKYGNLFLALSWTSGLVSGSIMFRSSDIFLSSLMRMSVLSHVSIVGLLTSVILPFLFSAFAVYLVLPQLLIPISLCKGFSFAFVSCGVLASFGSAGWLVRFLLMFSDLCSVIVLYGYWTNYISGQKLFSLGKTVLVTAVLCVIAGFDYCCIAPLLRGVLTV